MKYPKDTSIKCSCGRGTLDFIPEADLNNSGSRVLGRLVGCCECEMDSVRAKIMADKKRETPIEVDFIEIAGLLPA